MQVQTASLAATDDWQVVHGKDLLGFLSWYFEIPERMAMGLVTLSLATSKAAVLAQPNIQSVDRWVRGL